MASSSSSDDGDVPRGFPSLTRLTLHEHSPPPLPQRGQRSSIFLSGLSGDVIPEFRNIALQEHPPSPLPHSEHRSSDVPPEPSSPPMAPVIEQSGNVSDPEFGLPPPAYTHTRGNRPRAGRGHRRAHSALHRGHSGRNSYGGIHRRLPSQRSGDSALTTMVRNRLRASEQRSEQHDNTQLPTPDRAAGSDNPSGGITAPDWSSFTPAWQGTTPETWSVHHVRSRSAAPEGDVRRSHLFRAFYGGACFSDILNLPSSSLQPPSPSRQSDDAVMGEDSLGQRQARFRRFSREEREGSGRRACIYSRAVYV